MSPPIPAKEFRRLVEAMTKVPNATSRYEAKWPLADFLLSHAPALLALVEGEGWQDISTAPKGELVFVWREGWENAHLAKQIQRDSEKEDGSECWFWGWQFESDSVCYGVEDGFLGWIEDEADKCMPTHWMRKPPPKDIQHER